MHQHPEIYPAHSLLQAFNPHGHLRSDLPRNLGARQDRRVLLYLRVRTIRELEGITAYQDEKDSLHPGRMSNCQSAITRDRLTKRTLSSVSAKVFPRHVRGPSENDSICRWPWISRAFAMLSPPSSQRSGSNSLAVAPQNTSAQFMYRMGDETTVPLRMTRLRVCAPDAVVMGVEKGMMSSSVACGWIAVSGI